MKKTQTKNEYKKYVETVTPKHNCLLNCLRAFFVGGIICTAGQLILNICANYFSLDKTDSGSYCSVILILISILLTSFGIYKPLAKYGGAGALVPITGFANSVCAPTIEYKKEGEVFGKGVKIFTIAGPVILFGIVTSFVAGLIYYIILCFK